MKFPAVGTKGKIKAKYINFSFISFVQDVSVSTVNIKMNQIISRGNLFHLRYVCLSGICT